MLEVVGFATCDRDGAADAIRGLTLIAGQQIDRHRCKCISCDLDLPLNLGRVDFDKFSIVDAVHLSGLVIANEIGFPADQATCGVRKRAGF